MTGDTLYALRNLMNLNEQDFGELLGLRGENVKETIHAMEKGRKPISGPLQKLIPFIARQHGFTLTNGTWTHTDTQRESE